MLKIYGLVRHNCLFKPIGQIVSGDPPLLHPKYSQNSQNNTILYIINQRSLVHREVPLPAVDRPTHTKTDRQADIATYRLNRLWADSVKQNLAKKLK